MVRCLCETRNTTFFFPALQCYVQNVSIVVCRNFQNVPALIIAPQNSTVDRVAISQLVGLPRFMGYTIGHSIKSFLEIGEIDPALIGVLPVGATNK